MREIKFRAWHKGYKHWLKGDNSLLFAELQDGKNIELMQFTGLKDKNGVEIYEGDIVNVYHDDEFLFSHHVKWDDANGCCSITVNHCDYDITTVAWAEEYFCYEYEVVGNIHESPELQALNY